MTNEIKEKQQYLISLLYDLEEYSVSKEDIDKKYPLDLSQEEAKALLDYITNLQEKLNLYENPDDMTLFYMWLDEKAKDKMKELQEEIKEADEAVEYWQEECDNLQQRIDKTDKFLEELISSTKGVINDYSYHKEDNKILIELFEEDIEFYKNALDILRGDE